MKSKLRLNASAFSIIDSTPPFANKMLAAGFLVFFQFPKYYYFKYQSKKFKNRSNNKKL